MTMPTYPERLQDILNRLDALREDTATDLNDPDFDTYLSEAERSLEMAKELL